MYEKLTPFVTLFLAVFFLITPPLGAQQAGGTNVCIECHQESDEDYLRDPAIEFQKVENGSFVDAHARAGFSCVDCHGGDPTGDPTDETAAHDVAKGFFGVPFPDEIPKLCGRCHEDIEYMRRFNPRIPTDQLRLYRTSRHGKLLQQGEENVATCISCHGIHSIRPVNDPRSPVFAQNIPRTCAKCHSDQEYMEGFDIPTDQLDKYKRSEHARLLFEEGDTSAPTCKTCHGNHGAVPPGAASVHHVCGQCHTQNDEYFKLSTHAEHFEKEELPGCATCHGYHEIPSPETAKLLSNKPGSACMECHEENDKCYIYVEKVRGMFDQYREWRTRTINVLDQAERLGMSVRNPRFLVSQANDHIIRARTKIHQFKKGTVEEELESATGLIKTAYELGKGELREWQLRRIGLAISFIFIGLFIVGLILKIKEIEKK